jgi:ATP-dependent helicase/DNAse subunit B
VPLKLVTGPANAAKAGEVLGALRARVHEEPILVVPTFGDVEHNQRELAARGAVFGVEVVRFERLYRRVAERAGYSATVASEVQRQLLVEQAVRDARLRVLRASAERPGFARAAVRLTEELGRSAVEPDRFERALLAWAGDGPRRGYAEELATLYGRYRDGLDAAGLVDSELFARRALDALRREPARWRGTPVFVYGFDDFTPLELDALETLGRRADADVTVSLPFEPGRPAFKAVAAVHEELSAIASERKPLEAVSDHYADASRAALHHLERHLFDDDPGERASPGPAVRAHSAGGERAEVELVGADVLGLLRAGTLPGEVAVVFRDPSRYASVVEQVFDAYGIPFSIERAVPFSHTGLGRGLLALLRCATGSGSADDLLTWLRTPGKLDQPARADELEAAVRRVGTDKAERARELWEEKNWPLDELDRLAGAGSLRDLVEELDGRLERLFAAPYERRAHVLAGPELDDARAFDAAHKALTELHSLLGSVPRMALDPSGLHDTLARLRVRVGENPQPDRVQVASPGEIRARRFQAVFLCGLQEGEFPRAASPEPFLPDEDRAAIATATDGALRLPLREDQLDRERYLFYVCASRAERLLVLSSRYCDEEGNPEAPSFFLEDAEDLFDELPERRRSLADVTWRPDEAPTPAEYERAVALRAERQPDPGPSPLTAPEVLAALERETSVSASALEHFADCPVKWLVEDVLRPRALEPDPEAMVRGSYAHDVLAASYRQLHEETGDRRPTRGNLARAEQILLDELRARQGRFPISPKQTRVRAALRRLEFDLLRYLRHEAGRRSDFEPKELEFPFGGEHGPAVEVGGVPIKGRIDRVDTSDGWVLVRDYKSGRDVSLYKAADWEAKHRFQAALYLHVAEQLLGLKPAGAVYVALGGKERRPRGLLAEDVRDELGGDFFDQDIKPHEEFEERMAAALELVGDTAAAMRGGQLKACPDSCAWRGGCSYPSICRTET